MVGSVNKLLLISRDHYGNKTTSGGDHYYVQLHDVQNEIELDGFVSDNADGSYTVSYFPTCIPQPLPDYMVSIYLQSHSNEEDTRTDSEDEQDKLVQVAGSPLALHPLHHEKNTRAAHIQPFSKVYHPLTVLFLFVRHESHCLTCPIVITIEEKVLRAGIEKEITIRRVSHQSGDERNTTHKKIKSSRSTRRKGRKWRTNYVA